MTLSELRHAARAFEQAVDMAARGSGGVHERLVLAYERFLVTLRPEMLPPGLRGRFRRLHDRLCDLPPGDDARAYVAHFKALYPDQATELLAELVDLKHALRLALAEHEAC